MTYAEEAARWPQYIDRFGVMKAALLEAAPNRHQHKFSVVGDLMADVQAITDRKAITTALDCPSDTEILGFLPGSKPSKLAAQPPASFSLRRWCGP